MCTIKLAPSLGWPNSSFFLSNIGKVVFTEWTLIRSSVQFSLFTSENKVLSPCKLSCHRFFQEHIFFRSHRRLQLHDRKLVGTISEHEDNSSRVQPRWKFDYEIPRRGQEETHQHNRGHFHMSGIQRAWVSFIHSLMYLFMIEARNSEITSRLLGL